MKLKERFILFNYQFATTFARVTSLPLTQEEVAGTQDLAKICVDEHEPLWYFAAAEISQDLAMHLRGGT